MVLFVAVAAGLVIQRDRIEWLQHENLTLGEQVGQLTARVDELTADKAELAKLLAAKESNAGPGLAPELFSELLRLRGEVARQRQAEREAEQKKLADKQALAEKRARQATFEVDTAELRANVEKAHAKAEAEVQRAWERFSEATEANREIALAELSKAAATAEALKQMLVTVAQDQSPVRVWFVNPAAEEKPLMDGYVVCQREGGRVE
jgi:hypothetical protein